MIIGLTIERMKTEIRSLPTKQLRVKAIYGFGSFFRGEFFRDVDLAVVVFEAASYELSSYYELKREVDLMGIRLGVVFHLSIFTEEEFHARPLRDMNQLVYITGADIISDHSAQT
jgi:predicted nucleotidyltransferase